MRDARRVSKSKEMTNQSDSSQYRSYLGPLFFFISFWIWRWKTLPILHFSPFFMTCEFDFDQSLVCFFFLHLMTQIRIRRTMITRGERNMTDEEKYKQSSKEQRRRKESNYTKFSKAKREASDAGGGGHMTFEYLKIVPWTVTETVAVSSCPSELKARHVYRPWRLLRLVCINSVPLSSKRSPGGIVRFVINNSPPLLCCCCCCWPG